MNLSLSRLYNKLTAQKVHYYEGLARTPLEEAAQTAVTDLIDKAAGAVEDIKMGRLSNRTSGFQGTFKEEDGVLTFLKASKTEGEDTEQIEYRAKGPKAKIWFSHSFHVPGFGTLTDEQQARVKPEIYAYRVDYQEFSW